MRLLNANTLALETFFDKEIPPYAILSHTWGNDEVTFQDIASAEVSSKAGYQKIKYTCEQALRDGLRYAWDDTCCINKTSSAELSEAINSMFTWYARAKVCYAYLVDVDHDSPVKLNRSAFSKSLWFTRGWTLQELLAPSDFVFYSTSWQPLGTREELGQLISSITEINESYLSGKADFRGASIAERMRWASKRNTTRIEDRAYCLLGIFGVNIPLIYGEGTKAFIRLQEEILKWSDDQSILAWNPPPDAPKSDTTGILALTPAAFAESRDLVPVDIGKLGSHFSVTNKGLYIRLPLWKSSPESALLQCRQVNSTMTLVAIPLVRQRDNLYARAQAPWKMVKYQNCSKWPTESLYLLQQYHSILDKKEDEHYNFLIRALPPGFSVAGVYPPELGSAESGILSLGTSGETGMGVEHQGVIALSQQPGDQTVYLVFWLREFYRDKAKSKTVTSLFELIIDKYMALRLIWADYRLISEPFPKLDGENPSVQGFGCLSPHQLRGMPRHLNVNGETLYVTLRREEIYGKRLIVADVMLSSDGFSLSLWKLWSQAETTIYRYYRKIIDDHAVLQLWEQRFKDLLQTCLDVVSFIFQLLDFFSMMFFLISCFIWVLSPLYSRPLMLILRAISVIILFTREWISPYIIMYFCFVAIEYTSPERFKTWWAPDVARNIILVAALDMWWDFGLRSSWVPIFSELRALLIYLGNFALFLIRFSSILMLSLLISWRFVSLSWDECDTPSCVMAHQSHFQSSCKEINLKAEKQQGLQQD
ncbi:heterokaryon incompatibility protein-domain-containing protein [Xylogone sp. PMI_703]|nr:heterokaryon incompatibility protein-domain-containing protein [Xylogone sp. PMI_703]